MTVTIDRLGKIVTAGERLDVAGFKLRRSSIDEELQRAYDDALQAVVDLTVTEDEVLEIEASYNHSLDSYRNRPNDNQTAERHRGASRALTYARRANRIYRESTGERVPGVSVTED